MNTVLKCAALAALAGLAGGCVTTPAARDRAAREQAEFDRVKSDVYRLSEQMRGLAAAQEQLAQDVQRLRDDNARERGALNGRVEELAASVRQAAARLESLREEIVAALSKRMAEVLRMQAGRTGNEHVVQAGDTLSGIAARYGCTVRALQQANNLQDADTIRVGQRLTLP